MGLLAWLEASWLGEWVRMSTAGYPTAITLHAIGMAIMVGLAVALDMRLLGWFKAIPLQSLLRFLGIAWIGLGVNFISGLGLFSAEATTVIKDVPFVLKMIFVILGAITAALLQNSVGRDWTKWGEVVPGSVRFLAALSIFFWTGAIVAGRLTAYL